MPIEDRRIMFDEQEVYQALYAMCTQKQMKIPPPGTISKVVQDEDDAGMITVTISNPQDNKNAQTHVEYSRDFFAAALMLFCRGRGIPLPKSAKKSVLISEGTVILRAKIG